jgi:hypothetical protein
MPALLGYLLAISLLLGGGYVSLHWLSTPDDISTSQRPSASKAPPAGKNVVGKSDPDATAETRAEKRAHDHAETEIPATGANSEPSNKAAPDAPPNETGVGEENTKVQTKKTEDAPADGCMPIGVTARGKLVFPIQCQAQLEQYRGPGDPQPPVQTNPMQSAPAPKERQAAEPARPVGDENTGLNRTKASSAEANAKIEDVAGSSEAKPGKESLEPEVVKGKKLGKRNMRSSHSRPTMMILRTIEFPDGHLEERLLPMSRSRRTTLRTEEQWFDPPTFR